METIEKSIEVDAPIDKVYNQWTQFEDFPRFMEGVERVNQLDDKHLHWVAKVAGRRLEQIPRERIAWRSVSGAPNSGVVHFRQSDPGHTVVTLRMSYEPEGAMESIASALGVLGGRVESDLKHFKDFIQHRGTETGAWRGKIRHGDVKDDGSTGTM